MKSHYTSTPSQLETELLRAMFKLMHSNAIAFAQWRSAMRKLFPGFDEYKPKRKKD